MYICFVRASSPYDCRVVCSIFLNHIQFVNPRPAATTAAADFRGKYPKMLYLCAACKRAFSPDPCFGQPWRPGFHLWTIIDVRVPRQAASRREWNNAKLETNCFRAAFYAYFLFMLQYHLAQLVVRLVWIFSHANVHQNVCLERGDTNGSAAVCCMRSDATCRNVPNAVFWQWSMFIGSPWTRGRAVQYQGLLCIKSIWLSVVF